MHSSQVQPFVAVVVVVVGGGSCESLSVPAPLSLSVPQIAQLVFAVIVISLTKVHAVQDHSTEAGVDNGVEDVKPEKAVQAVEFVGSERGVEVVFSH